MYSTNLVSILVCILDIIVRAIMGTLTWQSLFRFKYGASAFYRGMLIAFKRFEDQSDQESFEHKKVNDF